jgi:hypothetical protein
MPEGQPVSGTPPGNMHDSLERFAREVPRPNVRLPYNCLALVPRYLNHQITAHDTAAQTAPEQKAETAEHSSLGNVSS